MKKFLTFLILIVGLTFGAFANESKITLRVKELDKIEFMNATSLDLVRGYLFYDTGNSQSCCVGFTLKDTGDKFTASIGDWEYLIADKTCEFKLVIYDVNDAKKYGISYHMSDGSTLYIVIYEVYN